MIYAFMPGPDFQTFRISSVGPDHQFIQLINLERQTNVEFNIREDQQCFSWDAPQHPD